LIHCADSKGFSGQFWADYPWTLPTRYRLPHFARYTIPEMLYCRHLSLLESASSDSSMSAAQTCFVAFIGALLDWIVAYNKTEHGMA
jgi:hypothetical protein